MLHTVSLKENHVFRRLYHRGATAGNRLLVVYCLRNGTGHSRLGLTVSHHAQRLHAAAVRGIFHPADILHDAAGRHVRRLDNRRQTIRFRELDEIVLIHLGDDLRYFLMIRERGDDEVRLVRLRERDERVRLRQALLAQNAFWKSSDDQCGKL